MGHRSAGIVILALVFLAIGIAQLVSLGIVAGMSSSLTSLFETLEACLADSDVAGNWYVKGVSGIGGLAGIYASMIGYAALTLAIGVGLWRLQRWGWWLAVAYLVFGLLNVFNSSMSPIPVYVEGFRIVNVLLPLVLLAYLVRGSIRQRYLQSQETPSGVS